MRVAKELCGGGFSTAGLAVAAACGTLGSSNRRQADAVRESRSSTCASVSDAQRAASQAGAPGDGVRSTMWAHSLCKGRFCHLVSYCCHLSIAVSHWVSSRSWSAERGTISNVEVLGVEAAPGSVCAAACE